MFFVYSLSHTKIASYVYHYPIINKYDLVTYNNNEDIDGIIIYTYHPKKSSKSYVLDSYLSLNIVDDIDQYNMLTDKKVISFEIKNNLNNILNYLKNINWKKKIILNPLQLSDYMAKYSIIYDIKRTDLDINLMIDSSKIKIDSTLNYKSTYQNLFT